MLSSVFKKILRNQRLIPVIDLNQNRLLAEMRRWQIENSLLNDRKPGTTEHSIIPDKKVIVSLTSYGRRLFDVPYAIESIMRGSIKPNRIRLYIDTRDIDNIPTTLDNLCQRGLEIIPTADNIRSYKKLHHSLSDFPDDIIVTIDDDVIYEYDLLERLLDSYKNNPSSIHCARCHRIAFDKSGNLMPYNRWQWNYNIPSTSHLNFLTGVGGVLYPPGTLAAEATDSKLFASLAPTADDVWYFLMALKRGTSITKVATRNPSGNDYVENYAFHDEGLMQINTKQGCLNDRQIRAVMEYFNLQICPE